MDDTNLFRLIGTISRQATNEVNQQVKAYGLDNNLFLYLLRVLEEPGLTQFKLTQLVQVDKTTMSRSLKKLETQGYITKQSDPANKNFKKIFPTPAALAIEKTISAVEEDYIKIKLQTLSTDAKQDLSKLLVMIQESHKNEQ
ncbi:MarR family winged helix-turn-helix transcriptional regulator [Fructobacillus ficulneus]|uniref:HTH marR-type domain-containing protein n=1 Tax=Fructobacillus ficulneus TaxID=157463 RepID=A0A0K8MIC3_9LACO|nr:MarR family transcriptional regulator [Fructobacillus ficulneus]GAO99614.1 hypothetical protein FFIC_231000 [Fructobacillus ficulneus]